MAGGMDLGSPSKGGKKPLDTAINLVPFIDLMAVTISFLIMTAVWTQIGRLQVAQSGGDADPSEAPEKPPLVLNLLVSDKALKLDANGAGFEIPVVRDAKQRLDLIKLTDRIREIKTQFPDHSNITVQAEDSVRYEDLVRIIDEVTPQLPNVNVAAAG